MSSPEPKLTWEEILSKFPAAAAIAMTLVSAVNDARADGKITGQEYGKILASVAEDLGKLVDEVIAEAAD